MSRGERFEWERAIMAADLPAPARLLAFVLATRTRSGSLHIPDAYQPSITRLQQDTGLARSAVARNLNLLEERNWLRRDRPAVSRARAEHARTRYVPLWPQPTGASPSKGLALVLEENRASPRRELSTENPTDLEHSGRTPDSVNDVDRGAQIIETEASTPTQSVDNSGTDQGKTSPADRESAGNDPDAPDVLPVNWKPNTAHRAVFTDLADELHPSTLDDLADEFTRNADANRVARTNWDATFTAYLKAHAADRAETEFGDLTGDPTPTQGPVEAWDRLFATVDVPTRKAEMRSSPW